MFGRPTKLAGHVFVIFGREWGRVENALGRADTSIPLRTRDETKDQAEKLAAEAAREVSTLPVRGRSGTTGLRKRVAAGVRVIGGEGKYRVVTTMAKRDEAIIPRGLDRKAGWRHPVFGNRSNWVIQRPLRSGWFTDTMQGGRRPIQNALEDELEKSAHRIAAAGNQRGVPGI